ncbi:MAG TPA: cytochrome C biogenesis protein, partial [Coriobacteriia bacterium]
MTLEIVLMWAAVTAYAAGAILYITGFVFRIPKAMSWATRVSLAGLVPHTAAMAVRWVRIGHAPFLGFYEVVS